MPNPILRRISLPLVVFSLLVVLLNGTAVPAAAQSTISLSNFHCRITTSDYVHVQFQLDVAGQSGHEIVVAGWPVYADDGGTIVSSNSSYVDSSGYIVGYERVSVIRDVSRWDAMTLDIPMSAFPDGDYDFYMSMEVQDRHGNLLTNIEAYDCSFTHPSSGAGDSTGTPGGTNTGGNGGSTSGLNATLMPIYGTLSLHSGFTPMPRRTSIYTGGSLYILDYINNSSCRGYTTSAPTMNVEWSGGGSMLRIYTEGTGDTTLAVLRPSGDWSCDDNSGTGANAEVTLSRPDDGVYSVWIGHFGHYGTDSVMYVDLFVGQ